MTQKRLLFRPLESKLNDLVSRPPIGQTDLPGIKHVFQFPFLLLPHTRNRRQDTLITITADLIGPVATTGRCLVLGLLQCAEEGELPNKIHPPGYGVQQRVFDV